MAFRWVLPMLYGLVLSLFFISYANGMTVIKKRISNGGLVICDSPLANTFMIVMNLVFGK
jgi:hypothetical protein